MTSLVLGLAVGALGQMVGIPFSVGFLVGSMIGSLIDPPKQQGPKLSDLKLQTATYGKMIPWFWGKGRLGGNIIMQTDLEEHKQKSDGKGGPVITNFVYSASFAISLGAARRFGEDAMVGVLRIWADGRLIWSIDDGTNIPCTVYTGSETQLPDPTFEAIHGVGEVPAYRGQAYVVFSDYYLTDYGNRIPSFEFEVFTGAGEYPYQVSTGAPWHNLNDQEPSFTKDGDNLIVTTYGDTGYRYMVFDIATLTQIGSTVYSYPTWIRYSSAVNSHYTPAASGPFDKKWLAPDITGMFQEGTDISGTANFTPSKLQGDQSVVQGDNYYSLDGGISAAYVNSYRTGDGFLTSYYLGAINQDACVLGHDSETGNIFVVFDSVGASEMWMLDGDLNLINHWTAGDLSGTLLTNGARYNFVVYKDQICFNYQVGPLRFAALVDIGPGYVLSDSSHGPLLLLAEGRFGYLGGGLVACQGGGVFSLNPPPEAVLLSTIVGDLSDMTPLTAYDVTDLYDEVRWFVIGSQMIVRNAIQTLRSMFFFDAVESDDLVRFVRRDAFGESPSRPIYQIPDGDLDARSYGETSGPLLRTIRRKEQDLPRTVAINYIDVDTDYQIGSQSTPRQTTLSQQDVTIDAPVGLTADEALQKCWALLTSEWVERESFEFSTTRKWAKLQPCDLVYVRGRVIRILTVTESPNGVLKFAGVLAAPSLYTSSIASLYYQIAPGAPSDGFVPPDSPGAKVATQMVFLDIPILQDIDAPNGFYVAVAPVASGSWTGAEILKSTDGGTTYNSVGSATDASTMGAVAAALGNWTGGNNFDESHIITVTIGYGGGTLSSASEDAVLNGENLFALGSAATGWEMIQFKTATLVSANVYELSGLLRGRFGTEWMMPLHGAGETFVLASTLINIIAPFSDFGSARLYKAVSYGLTLASATAQSFQNTGVAIKPYAPVNFEAGRNAAGDLTMTWVRRTRLHGIWLENVEVPVSETTEYYRVFIYPDNTYTVGAHSREIYISPAQTTTYSAADQTSDFGSPQAIVYATVAQGGTIGDGYATRGAL